MNPTNRANPPRFMFVQTNQRCNLKCTHCEYWKLDDDDRANYLSTERRTGAQLCTNASLTPAHWEVLAKYIELAAQAEESSRGLIPGGGIPSEALPPEPDEG